MWRLISNPMNVVCYFYNQLNQAGKYAVRSRFKTVANLSVAGPFLISIILTEPSFERRASMDVWVGNSDVRTVLMGELMGVV